MAICDSKLCSSCKEIKSITEFAKCSKAKDGLQHKCKQCDKARLRDAYTKTREKQIAKAKAWNAAHKAEKKEYKRQYQKEYSARNADRLRDYRLTYYKANMDRIKQQAAQYRITNIEHYKEKDAVYHKENRNKRLSYLRNWQENNPDYGAKWRAENQEKGCTYSRNRRARKKVSTGSHTKDDIMQLLVLQRYRCAVCRCSIKSMYHVDHIYPLVSGGNNRKENLQLLCPACNLSKHAKHPIDFMNQRGFLL